MMGHRIPIENEPDTQRSKLYKAEEVLKPYAIELPKVEHIQEFVDALKNNKPLMSRYGKELSRRIIVGDGRRRRRAAGDSTGIYMPKWARDTWVTLHEVAHTIAQRRHSWRIAGHGREYCSIYLDLVRFVMGREVHGVLVESFKKHRVKYKAKKASSPLSEERRLQLRVQLAAARLAKAEANPTRAMEPVNVERDFVRCIKCQALINRKYIYQHADICQKEKERK